MRKWVRLITHQTRLEGNKGGRFIIFCTASLGGITGQVKVLNKNCVGTFKDLQFYGTGGGHRHVRFFGKARHSLSILPAYSSLPLQDSPLLHSLSLWMCKTPRSGLVSVCSALICSRKVGQELELEGMKLINKSE